MPAGKAHSRKPAATSVVYGWSSWRVSQRVTLWPLEGRPVVSSCYPCHPTLVAGTCGVLVARMCQSTRSRVICSHWSVLTPPTAAGPGNNSWSNSPPQCAIDLRHVNLENKFLVSTMIPNHACHRNKHEGDQQSFMKTWTPCGARRKGLKGLILHSVFWLSVGILIAGTSRPGHSINCLSTSAC